MNNSKPTLVLMAGLSGAGKSSLALALASKLQWYLVYRDGYREVLIREGLSEEMASWIAYELAFDTAWRVLTKQKASVIFDSSALHSFVLTWALNVVRHSANARLRVVLCIADQDLRRRRVQSRPPQDWYTKVDPVTRDDYLRYYKHLPPDTLILNTAKPLEECLTIVKYYLLSDW